MKKRWSPQFALGVIAGALLMLVLAALSGPGFQRQPPTTAPQNGTLELTIVDAVTDQPVTATVTIRRETLDGEVIGDEDGETYTGQQITIEAPVEPNVRLDVLVESPGYRDWELKIVVKKPAQLGGPVRLMPLATSPPKVQG